MIGLKKKIVTKVLQKEEKKIRDFIVKINSFSTKVEVFAESMSDSTYIHPKALHNLRSSASALCIREVEDFFLAWGELGEIEEILMMLKGRKKGVDIQKIETLLNEIEVIARPVKSVARTAHLIDWTESIIVAFILAMIIRMFVVQAFKIPTGSMRPTLLEGDVIMVNKFIYGAKIPFTDLRLPKVRQPKRGDVIVFVYPGNPKKDFIKRLAAFAGETVEIKNGTVYVNDKPLLEPIFNQRYYYNRGEFGKEEEKVVVPGNSFFVLGDNSASSQDSRYWGFVPRENILGKAILIYWPLNRIRIIK